MDNLLCNENWLTTPTTTQHYCSVETPRNHVPFYTTREDCEHAFSVCLHKEITYMPEFEHLDYLQSSNMIVFRARAIQWFIKSQRRLNLLPAVVFDAANYLDRFVSVNQCHWNYWMIEILSVACLSIAAKFSDISIPSLHEIQMEDLNYSFQPNTIKQMELTVLQVLEWRLACITAYSYVELLTSNLDPLQSHLRDVLTSRVTELLLTYLSETKLLKFRPSTIAVSAFRCTLEELFPSKSQTLLTCISGLIPHGHEDDLYNCYKIMEDRQADTPYNLVPCRFSSIPSSPKTVMTTARIGVHDCFVDMPSFTIPGPKDNHELNSRKRKREEGTMRIPMQA